MKKYIETDAALDAVDKAVELYPSEWEKIEQAIADIPAVDVEPVRHAEWTKVEYRTESGRKYINYHCSECGRKLIGYDNPKDAPYCHCGCKMDGGSEE